MESVVPLPTLLIEKPGYLFLLTPGLPGAGYVAPHGAQLPYG